MPPKDGAYITGFCGGRNPESHVACKGFVTQGSAVGGALTCSCTCHTGEREEFLNKLIEAISWRTVDRKTGETKFWRTEAEARAYAKTTEEPCENCNGVGSIPASGGESEDEVDNGYVQCPTCKPTPVSDRAAEPEITDGEPRPKVTAAAHQDRNHHLTAEGKQRLVEWAELNA